MAFLGLADAELYLLSVFCCRVSGKVGLVLIKFYGSLRRNFANNFSTCDVQRSSIRPMSLTSQCELVVRFVNV